MPDTKKQPKPSASQQRAVMRSLSQQVAAELIGEQTAWLRNHVHRVPRNEDGSYDAFALVEFVRSEVEVELPELAEPQLELAFTVAEKLAGDLEGSVPVVIRLFKSLEENYGPAGLAALASAILERLVEWEKSFPTKIDLPPTPEEIRAKAEREIAELPNWNAHRELRTLGRCERCKKYRWGRQWLPGDVPTGYVTLGDICPACLAKERREQNQ